MVQDVKRILVAGATGTIGRAVSAELVARGHRVTSLLRAGRSTADLPPGVATHDGGPLDAVVSCIASRSGVAEDAWAVDHGANLELLTLARAAGATRFLLLSAICVQKPELAFQQAKLAFEAALQGADIGWTIVRPTAFFKSLSGQVARVQAGKPFMVFGDGQNTACKPISDADLAEFIADRLFDPNALNRVLPIGGTGPAITPADQAALLGDLLGRPVPLRRVPPRLMDGIVTLLDVGARLLPRLAAKAELARIGRYYSRESMLVWDPGAQAYDADATPEHGTQTLRDHYAALLRGEATHDLGAQAVFAPTRKDGPRP